MKRFLQWAFVAVFTLTTAAVSVALYKPPPASLYQVSNKKEMTQAEQWQLDFDLANEYSQGKANNWRFININDRGIWFDEVAKSYEIADLLRQTFIFHYGYTYNNEKAFNRETMGVRLNAVHLSKSAISLGHHHPVKGVAHGRQSSNLAIWRSPR